MKVLLLVHHKLIPPEAPQAEQRVKKASWRTEYDVKAALKRLGHKVEVLGLAGDLGPLMDKIKQSRPDIIFNLLEEFAGEAVLDQNIVNYLELLGLPYTGCNGRGLALARDKVIAKKIVAYEGLHTPPFFTVSRGQHTVEIPEDIRFPMIVKCLTEEASLGIDQKSVVHSKRELKKQIIKMQTHFNEDLLIEEYVEGRELYVGVLGNETIKILPARELHFGRMPGYAARIASAQVKWSVSYRKRHGIHSRLVHDDGAPFLRRLRQAAKQAYRALRLSGYARIDFRIDGHGKIYFIEANPNPQICKNEDFADAAKTAGLSFDQLIQKVLDLGRRAKLHTSAQV